MMPLRFALPLLLGLLLTSAGLAQDTGLRVQPVPDNLRAHLPALKEDQGLLIADIDADSRAYELGLRRHDIVLTIGKDMVRGDDDLQEKLDALPIKPSVPVRIVRAGQTRTLNVAGSVSRSFSSSSAYDPAKSLLKPGAPPAVSVEVKSKGDGDLEVNLFFLNRERKMERHQLSGSLDAIERQFGTLTRDSRLTAEVQDLLGLALQRLRARQQPAQATP